MPASIAIVLNADRSQVLLVKRRDVPIWVLPGGGIEKGESPEEAAIREVEEESGVKATIVRRVAEYVPVNRLASFTYLFECRLISGTPKQTDESIETAFFPLNQLPKTFFIIHKDFLDDALSNQSGVIYKKLDQVNYTRLVRYFLSSPMQVIRFGLSRLGIPFNN